MMADLQPVLKGELLTLRPLKEEDRDALFAVASDPLIWEQHPQSDRYQRPVFDALFDGAMKSQGSLLALDVKTGSVLGSSRYYDWDPAAKSIVIGYTFLSRACWGGAYNKEMKRLMLDHAFRFATDVFFYVNKSNRRSAKAMEKISGTLVGEEEKTIAGGGTDIYLIYRISKR